MYKTSIAFFIALSLGLQVICIDGVLENNALHRACIRGNLFKVIALLATKSGKSQINQYGDAGFKPLHYAAMHGFARISKILLQHNATANAISYHDKSTPLHLAVIKGDHNTIDYLLQAKANASACNLSNLTPLHYAMMRGHVRIVSLLLKYDAYVVNPKNIEGQTSLHLACHLHHFDKACLLVKWGADIDTLDNQGRTPLQLALTDLKGSLLELTQERLQAIHVFTDRLKQGGNLPALPAELVNHVMLPMILTTNQRKRFDALAPYDPAKND